MTTYRFDPHRLGALPALASLRAPLESGGLHTYGRIIWRLKQSYSDAATRVQGDPLEEYKSLCEFLRLYATLRFYQLALLLGTSGAIVTALLTPALGRLPYGGVLLRCTGVIVAVALGVMEFRASSYWHRLRDRANRLCALLRFEPFPVSSRWNPLTTSGAGFYLHLLVVVGWIATLALHRAMT
jgi:hypothetical protein